MFLFNVCDSYRAQVQTGGKPKVGFLKLRLEVEFIVITKLSLHMGK